MEKTQECLKYTMSIKTSFNMIHFKKNDTYKVV